LRCTKLILKIRSSGNSNEPSVYTKKIRNFLNIWRAIRASVRTALNCVTSHYINTCHLTIVREEKRQYKRLYSILNRLCVYKEVLKGRIMWDENRSANTTQSYYTRYITCKYRGEERIKTGPRQVHNNSILLSLLACLCIPNFRQNTMNDNNTTQLITEFRGTDKSVHTCPIREWRVTVKCKGIFIKMRFRTQIPQCIVTFSLCATFTEHTK
jgi:hypothetical protein